MPIAMKCIVASIAADIAANPRTTSAGAGRLGGRQHQHRQGDAQADRAHVGGADWALRPALQLGTDPSGFVIGKAAHAAIMRSRRIGIPEGRQSLLDFNLMALAAILTIAGYSIND
ncbi:MAG TPA: hypothetical protein VK634_16625, partial [Reyranella sp.]|nr:hypothetical protein [Reyranella sp.]